VSKIPANKSDEKPDGQDHITCHGNNDCCFTTGGSK